MSDLKKPDLLSLPEAKFEAETRLLTDPENQPGIEFPVTLRRPDPLSRGPVAALSREYMELYATGKAGANGKKKGEPNLFPAMDGRKLKLDEDTAAELGIMEGLQPPDAPVRWNGPEIVLLIHRAPAVFEAWRLWALSLWNRNSSSGNSDGAAQTT